MNRDEYIRLAKSILVENFRPNDLDGSMTAASAAYLLKRRIGDFGSAGFFKFKDLLFQLQSECFLITGPNSKNAFSFKLLQNTQQPTPDFIAMRQKRLKADVWYAFVKADPPGKRFFNTFTGDIRSSQDESPGGEWVEVFPIAIDQEKQNAIDFLKQKGITAESPRQAIQEPKWYLTFVKSLFEESPQLANDWKRERSRAVVEVVEKWREANGIPPALVYESNVVSDKFRPERSMPLVATQNQDALREALLNSILRMTTKELLQVRIPASILIREIRPDLLQ